ncbi:hypothetical protein RJT34_17533 [Clitoria ternatea]|uniref:Uncharacterized protein n=1 Tax=Clitoria ternatea TaxID=43366 RepID=A0AAN9JBB3_CLITE
MAWCNCCRRQGTAESSIQIKATLLESLSFAFPVLLLFRLPSSRAFECHALNTLPSKGTTTKHEIHAFGSSDGRDTLLWSEGLAFEPFNKKSSRQSHWNHMHKIHVPLNPNAKCPKRKRKSNKYTNGDKCASTLGLITKEKYGNQNDILNNVEQCSLSKQDYSHLSDSDESIEGSKSNKQGNLKNHPNDIGNGSHCNNNIETSIKKTFESLVNEDLKDNHTLRAVIPIGPRFQAEVPKWDDTTNTRHHNSDDDAKWLGIKLWPIPDINMQYNGNGIGEDNPYSCPCEFPGSVDCVKLHVSERRELLKLEIGTTFSSWRFDEMGEDVSKTWTLVDQEEFESLVKLNPLSSDTNFWKLAKKHFPSKSMRCMVNYYHNVYIPRRLSMETRSSCGGVDSDDDQDENYINKNRTSTGGGRILKGTIGRKMRQLWRQ